MIKLTLYEESWVQGWIEGRLIVYAELVISVISDQSIDVDVEEFVETIGIPQSFTSATIDAYSSGITDPKSIVEQMNIDSDAFMSWRESAVRQGVAEYVKSVCEKRFGELPDWVLNKLSNAQDEELQKWLYGSHKYFHLEEIFLGFELGQQILQIPPDYWEERPFKKGMRRTLRVQLHEKFGDLPLWVDEIVYNLKYEQLLQMSRNILHADSIDCLLKDTR